MDNFHGNSNPLPPVNDPVKSAKKDITLVSVSLILWLLFSAFGASKILLYIEYGIIRSSAVILNYFGASAAANNIEHFLSSDLWNQLYNLFAYVLTMSFLLVTVKFLIKRHFQTPVFEQEPPQKFSDGFMYARLVPLYTLAICLSVPFAASVSIFTGIETIAGEQITISSNDGAFFVSFVYSVILPAFMEEYVFRKLILSNLLPFGKAFALLASSIFFACAHINAIAVASAFVIGLIIGIVYLKSESLVPCIFIHMINNTVAFAQTALSEFYPSLFETISSILMLCFLFLGLASIIVLFGGKKKLWSLNDDKFSSCPQKRYCEMNILSSKVFLSPAFIIFLVIVFLYGTIIY